jgi:hypothetical protein
VLYAPPGGETPGGAPVITGWKTIYGNRKPVIAGGQYVLDLSLQVED